MFCCCQQTTKISPSVEGDGTQSIIIDSTLPDNVKSKIQLISDTHSSYFKTPLVAYFFQNDLLADSIIENDYKITSWYSITSDTINLVAHINNFEAVALLLRFIDNKKTTVRFFRASHEVGNNRFKMNKDDSLSDQIKVPPIYYKLKLSVIPDTLRKQVVYGHIDMKSGEYFDSRDSTNQTHNVQMKFYFRSQYKHFEY